MESIFLKLVNMSITASYLILAVIAFRLVLKKAPKYIRCILWGLVALRLVFPFSFESVLSLIPNEEPLSEEFLYAATPQIHTGITAVNNAINPVIAESLVPVEPASANPTQIWSFIFSRIWVIGMAVMALYAIISYLRLRRKVNASIPVGKQLRLCDHISSPFILGIIRPKIYLPSDIGQETANHVLSHEMAHLARRDHWWKPLGYLLLTVYWFNPLIWVAYILLCRDIELSCDERVVKKLDLEEKKAYSSALLRCSVSRRMITACPLAFGEVGVKSRIKSVLNYKKPAFWVIAVAVVASIIVGVCFLTDPPSDDSHTEQHDTLSNIINENGYTILNEREISLNITVPKSALPDSILTEEEHVFEENEIILYQTETGTLYLQGTYQDPNDTGEPYLVFEFNFSYSFPDSGTVLAPYHKTGNGYTVQVALDSKDVKDPYTTYTDAAYLRGTGPSCQLDISIKRSVYETASESVTFQINTFYEITYAKEGSSYLTPGTYDIGTLVGQNIALSYRPEEGDGQIVLSDNSMTVISDDGTVLYTGSDPVVTSSTWSEVSNHLAQDEQLTLFVSFISTLEDVVSMDVYEFCEDGEPRYTIYCTQGKPSMIYDSHRLFALEAIDTSNRLAPGSYIPVECIYMNPVSSYYPGNLSDDYSYRVTEKGFYTRGQYYICNANVDDVDWGWKTVAEAAEDLEFFMDWMNSEWAGIGLSDFLIDDGTLYQKLDAQTHLLLEDGNIYILHGSKARNEIETVWGIYRIVPESDVPDTTGQSVVQGEDIPTDIDLSDFFLKGEGIFTTLDLSDSG